MKRTLTQDTDQAMEFSILFGKVFMLLAVLDNPSAPCHRKAFLRWFTPCVSTICKLFYLSEEQLDSREADRQFLGARLTPWYLQFLQDYPGGELGASRMAVHLAIVHGQVQAGLPLRKFDVESVMDRLSRLEALTSKYAGLDSELEANLLELLESLKGVEPEAKTPDQELIEEAAGAVIKEVTYSEEDLPAILVYTRPISEYRREYYVINPVLSNPHVLMSTKDGMESELFWDFMNLIKDFESFSSISMKEHCIEIWIPIEGDWEQVEDDLEVVLTATLDTDRIAFYSFEEFEDEEFDED